MTQLVFAPWIGKNYTDNSRWGCRLLLMGESHYDEGFRQGAQLTSFVVNRHVRREGKQYAFWTNIARTFEGADYGSWSTRQRFWDSVAFYNYVQGFVGNGPRQRPSESLWQASRGAFWHVIETLRPHCIICFGITLWDMMPKPVAPEEKLNVAPLSGRYPMVRRYGAPSGHNAVAGFLRHPSSGYSWRAWGQWAEAILVHARVQGIDGHA